MPFSILSEVAVVGLGSENIQSEMWGLIFSCEFSGLDLILYHKSDWVTLAFKYDFYLFIYHQNLMLIRIKWSPAKISESPENLIVKAWLKCMEICIPKLLFKLNNLKLSLII